jgi:uncharacterized membrane protein YfcA
VSWFVLLLAVSCAWAQCESAADCAACLALSECSFCVDSTLCVLTSSAPQQCTTTITAPSTCPTTVASTTTDATTTTTTTAAATPTPTPTTTTDTTTTTATTTEATTTTTATITTTATTTTANTPTTQQSTTRGPTTPTIAGASTSTVSVTRTTSMPSNSTKMASSRKSSPCLTTADCSFDAVCEASVCSPCSSDAQCQEHSNVLMCGPVGLCQHKPLVPFDAPLDAGGIVVLLVGAMLAASAGIGGGEFYVPVLFLLMRFSIGEAIPLSSTLVLGLGLSNVVMLARQRHPYRDRPLIDVWLGAIFVPFLLIGTVVGILINNTVPSWFVLLVLFILMVVAITRSGVLARRLWLKETERAKRVETELAAVESAAGGTLERAGSKRKQRIALEQERSESERAAVSGLEASPSVQRLNAMALDYLMVKESRVKIGAVVVIATSLVIVAISSWLKGTNRDTSVLGTAPCSPVYWAVQFAPLIVLVAIWFVIARKLVHEQSMKETVPTYSAVEGDIAWRWPIAFGVAAASFFVGFITALVGVGGGVVLGPLFIELGVLPEVAAAVSSVISMCGGLSSVIQFAANDRIELGYGLLFLGVGIVGSLVGTNVTRRLVDRLDKSAVIVVVLVVMLAVSLVLVIATGVLVLTETASSESFAFRGVCSN